ncbi:MULTISPECIES: ROK family protein [unclassified Clostridium]|uniref:ROK family protein n=1 Tax=Clostridia TaxID=186801 RepID=UPI001105A4E2|nr:MULTISPECIES: ROK family protein [unclassified Clostridium]
METVNHDAMRAANMRSIFNCIRANGPVTKRQIQDRTLLSWGSVSNLCGILLERGVITQQKAQSAGPGRTPSGFDINVEDNLIIGIDVNLIGMTGVVIDLRSRVITRTRQAIESRHSGEVLAQMKALVSHLLQKVPSGSVKGIAVAFPGQVDADRGISIWTHQFGTFSSVNIRQYLQDAFGLEVILEHDPDCMAYSEHLLGAAQDIDNFIFVRLSLGISMGMMEDGSIYRGQRGVTGELGHMTLVPQGKKCLCGNRGCLETISSTRAILEQCRLALRQGRAKGLADRLHNHYEALTLEEAASAARAGDRDVKRIFSRAADYAGLAIANAANLIDPGAVVLGGELAEYGDLYVEPLQHSLARRAFGGALPLRIAQVGSDAAALGAASLFIERVFMRLSEGA